MTKDHSTPPVGVEVCGLVKRFGEVHALDGLSLVVPAATVYAVLGPNGAGKTTTIRILATLLRPDGGTAQVLGHDVVREADAVRRRICLTGQFAALDDDLTGSENLMLLGRLLGLSRPYAKVRGVELLDAFGLGDAADRRVSTYSGGMRRRLDLAASLIVRPDLWFLDEPSTGLDPQSRNDVWAIVRAVVAEGTTVLLTTQYLDEADQLADRIAVVDHGTVIAEGTPTSLKASVASGTLDVRLVDARERPRAADLLAAFLGTTVRLSHDQASLSAQLNEIDRVTDCLLEFRRAGIALSSFAVGQPRLDEVFLALTGRPRDDMTPQEQAA